MISASTGGRACGGFDETYIYRNEMEIEMAQRLMLRHTMINFGALVDFDQRVVGAYD
ncbi:MAG: hypothetical protein IH987_01260 [Planctomycetes bacterium]|nr:hypothetical protein [Planctomycetota bacterium]